MEFPGRGTFTASWYSLEIAKFLVSFSVFISDYRNCHDNKREVSNCIQFFQFPIILYPLNIILTFLWKAPPPTLWLRFASAFLHSWDRHTALHRLCALGLPPLSCMCTGSSLIFSQGMKFASLVNIKKRRGNLHYCLKQGATEDQVLTFWRCQ